MNIRWKQYSNSLTSVLHGLQASTLNGEAAPVDKVFLQWRDSTVAVRTNRSAVYLIGNGASASMASHFSADLAKTGGLHTQTFYDLSLMTAVSNDISFQQVFAEPLKRRCKRGEMLIAISSSGESLNVLNAVDIARAHGLTVVTLTGKNPSNRLRQTGDLNFYVPAETYGLTETAHAAVLHYWMDLVQLTDSDLS